MTRATYEAHKIENLIVIIDHDQGKSVTNDIDNVLADLAARGYVLHESVIIYRDTMGRWDQVVIRGKSVRFHALVNPVKVP